MTDLYMIPFHYLQYTLPILTGLVPIFATSPLIAY